nr:RNA-directed DNA polymerase, eukaryota [Tanacetum cinerariifolium]
MLYFQHSETAEEITRSQRRSIKKSWSSWAIKCYFVRTKSHTPWLEKDFILFNKTMHEHSETAEEITRSQRRSIKKSWSSWAIKCYFPGLGFSFRRNPRGGVEPHQMDNLVAVIKDSMLTPKEDTWAWTLDSSGVETSGHLFFGCDMIRQTYRLIVRWWCVPYDEFDDYDGWRSWLSSLRLSEKNKLMLERVFYVTWWCLWMARNKLIFEAKSPVKNMFFDDILCKSYNWCSAIDTVAGAIVPRAMATSQRQRRAYEAYEQFQVNGRTYKQGYYLADGIYRTWSTFVKTFSIARDEKTLKFKRVQESARKDIERAFGVLQETNMQRTWIERCDLHVRRSKELRDSLVHNELRHDLMNHLWNLDH